MVNIGITYKDSGVDVEAGNESVRRIKRHVQSTFNKSVLTGLGTFGALYDLGEIVKNYKNPVLVQSIDGVGTKLMIANAMGMHTTISIPMVVCIPIAFAMGMHTTIGIDMVVCIPIAFAIISFVPTPSILWTRTGFL